MLPFVIPVVLSALARIIHVGRAEGRAPCRNIANLVNSKPQGARMMLDRIATEVPAQQGFAWSGLHSV